MQNQIKIVYLHHERQTNNHLNKINAMNAIEMNYTANEIATILNVLVSDEMMSDKVLGYHEYLNAFIDDMAFETPTAKGFFRSAINIEFSYMENYRLVFSEIVYR